MLTLNLLAMWRDSSFGVPNKAAVQLLYPYADSSILDTNESASEFLQRYQLFRETSSNGSL
jgi:hypothetical protein